MQDDTGASGVAALRGLSGVVIRTKFCGIASIYCARDHATTFMAYGLTEGNEGDGARAAPDACGMALKDPDILREIPPAAHNQRPYWRSEGHYPCRKPAAGGEMYAVPADVFMAEVNKPDSHHAGQVQHVPEVGPGLRAPGKFFIQGAKL